MNMEYIWTSIFLWGFKSKTERGSEQRKAREREREKPAIWVKEIPGKKGRKISRIIFYRKLLKSLLSSIRGQHFTSSLYVSPEKSIPVHFLLPSEMRRHADVKEELNRKDCGTMPKTR